ncbi:hypothetical protein PMIN05_004514 [Paraphaeosphaeria minitans]
MRPFGLTVAPYAVVSLVNLLGSLARPDYDAVYMVGSPIMAEECRRKGLDGYYDGVVGEVFEADTDRHESFADNKVKEGSQSAKSPVKFVTMKTCMFSSRNTASQHLHTVKHPTRPSSR